MSRVELYITPFFKICRASNNDGGDGSPVWKNRRVTSNTYVPLYLLLFSMILKATLIVISIAVVVVIAFPAIKITRIARSRRCIKCAHKRIPYPKCAFKNLSLQLISILSIQVNTLRHGKKYPIYRQKHGHRKASWRLTIKPNSADCSLSRWYLHLYELRCVASTHYEA